MHDVAIRADGLGKRYRIGARATYQTIRERLSHLAASPWRHMHRKKAADQGDKNHFWALRDVSFEVRRGEAVGIIGRNGAGKSTLLKILSRITEPTAGAADLRGRVGSLLEVGTGFHPELTGRENVFLNGAILGMKRAETVRKFDDIVAFAEVEQFVDTAVKHYSSGMYMRLAFAVAAHLEPEILVVDEVLAVGDAQFQAKCLGKMGEVARNGRTVLFVSHNMGAIKTLTDRCLCMREGRLALDSTPDAAIALYLGTTTTTGPRAEDVAHYRRTDEGVNADALIRRVYASTSENQAARVVQAGQRLVIGVVVEAKRVVAGACVSIALFNARQERVAQLLSYDQGVRVSLPKGMGSITCTLPPLPLAPGDYYVDVGIARSADAHSWDVLLKVPLFRVADDLGQLEWHNRHWGCLHLRDVSWRVAGVDANQPITSDAR